MRYYKKLTMMTFLLFSGFCLENVAAQRGAIRNNLLYDATLTPNLGVDFRVDSLWTIGGLVGVNVWDIDKSANKKWRHLLVSANARRYLGDSLYHKSYVEGNFIYSHFNVGNTKIPFGLYNAVKNRRLHVGYAWFKEYECPTCGQFIGNDCRIFLLPQLGINVVYIIN